MECFPSRDTALTGAAVLSAGAARQEIKRRCVETSPGGGSLDRKKDITTIILILGYVLLIL